MIAFTANCLFTPLERVEQPLLLVEDHVIVEAGSRGALIVAAPLKILQGSGSPLRVFAMVPKR